MSNKNQFESQKYGRVLFIFLVILISAIVIAPSGCLDGDGDDDPQMIDDPDASTTTPDDNPDTTDEGEDTPADIKDDSTPEDNTQNIVVASSGRSGGSSSGSSSPVALTGISIVQADETVYAGETVQLTITFSPSTATNKALTWTSNDTTVATVSSSGLVTSVAGGVANITATSDDGGHTDSFVVTVDQTPTVSTATALQEAIEANGVTAINLGAGFTDDVTATRTGTTDFTIDFGAYTLTGDFTLTADSVGLITFDGIAGNSIDGNMTVSAASATVNNNINVSGTITIQAVSVNTWNQNGNAGQVDITANGGSFNRTSGNIGNVTITPPSKDNPIILKGNMGGINVTLKAPSNLEIDPDVDDVPDVNVDPDADGSEIENFKDAPMNVTANGNVTVGGQVNPLGSATVTQRQVRPTFNPVAGAVAPDTVLTITSLNADAIYYTLDGTNPATSVTGTTFLYDAGNKPEVSPGISVKAIATNTTKENSTISTAVYTPPVMGGTVSITGDAKFDETLTADISGVTYTPNTNVDVPTYQWMRSGSDISGATESTYTLVEADISEVITVIVTADGTNAVGSVASAATSAVAKADGPVAPAAPTLDSKTDTTVVLVEISDAEYRADAGAWQNDVTFTGLNAGTTYQFTARIKENATHLASDESAALSVTTDALHDVDLSILWAEQSDILIQIYRTVSGTDEAISGLTVDDFILIKDFGQPTEEVEDISLQPGGGTWEYEILPPLGESFDLGEYRLGFSKDGHNSAHVDFEILGPSSNANLSALVVDVGTLSPTFDADTTDYTVNVAHDVGSIEVTATLSDLTASLEINNTVAGSNVPMTVALNDTGQSTVIEVEVTAEDTTTTKTYIITVDRAEVPGISGANVNITEGSAVFSYEFFNATADMITYGAAQADPYHLNTTASTVRLERGSNATDDIPLANLNIGADGNVTYLNLTEAEAAFANPDFLDWGGAPTHIVLNLTGGQGAYVWDFDTVIAFSQEDMDAFMSIVSDDASLKTFTVGGEDVLYLLPGLEVVNPSDPGPLHEVADFTGLQGIVAEANYSTATVVITQYRDGILTDVTNTAATVDIQENDVITVTVVAEDGTTKYYKLMVVAADTTPAAGNSGITNQLQGADGSKEVTLTVTVQNAAGDSLAGYVGTDFTVAIDGAGAVDFTDAAFSGFADNGDGTYAVTYTGAADATGYDFTDLTVDSVVIEAGPTTVTTPAAA